MSEVNEEITRKIASLSRLKLSDEEVKRYTAQLTQVIHHVEKIAEVNVDGIEPLVYGIETTMPEREDIAKPFPLGADGGPKILDHAPQVLQDGFQVPPIL